MNLGFLYAGQGAQRVGMGLDLYNAYPSFAQFYDQIALDFDVKETSFTDSDGKLNQTQYTQPCMVAFAIGVTELLKAQNIRPSVVAGLSLGEYSALYAADVWDASTTLDTVAFRGKAMTQAAQGVDCAMMAVLGLGRNALEDACCKASSLGTVECANYNCPGQIVIAGTKEAVAKAAELAKEAGAKRCLPLKVSGPFHTSLLKAAGDDLATYFPTISFQSPTIPVLFNCLGGAMSNTDTIPHLLERQVQNSVYLEDCIATMAQQVDAIVEIGPGKALSGFVKKIAPKTPVFSVETLEDMQALAAKLEGVTPCT